MKLMIKHSNESEDIKTAVNLLQDLSCAEINEVSVFQS